MKDEKEEGEAKKPTKENSDDEGSDDGDDDEDGDEDNNDEDDDDQQAVNNLPQNRGYRRYRRKKYRFIKEDEDDGFGVEGGVDPEDADVALTKEERKNF
mmetsp:Transcript_41579/g.36957  ORF Transcript_41579/g.36957 Transcript_41579/m.36957 type:complete len:99 (+) Transcript_41579:3071-3367(+)